MAKGIILMTALVPTKGHQALVDFALHYCRNVNLIISSLNKEPIMGSTRHGAFHDQFIDNVFYDDFVVHMHTDNEAPQNPPDGDQTEFWNYWKDVVEDRVGKVNKDDNFFASEPYGLKMAEVLGCNFVPFDMKREMLNVKGTDVRTSLPWSMNQVMPSFQRHLIQNITIFGAESTGKTTLARNLATYLSGGYFIPEWARGYLETVGEELTPEKMFTIYKGQTALQNTARDLRDRPFIIQDTDLYSTIGYYRILGWEVPQPLLHYARILQSDLYIVTQSNIPFEPDILRYGGDVRQGSDEFWINILEEFKLPYKVLNGNEEWTKAYEAEKILCDMWDKDESNLKAIKYYVRD